ncbi:hypothetical protein D3C76_755520 [compost metagenome]
MTKAEWTNSHLEGLRKALAWPCWHFLPHGLDKDPSSILRQKAFGIVFYDRQLVINEKSNDRSAK